MAVEILESVEAMRARRAQWQALFDRAQDRTLFGEPDFCLNWYAHFGRCADLHPPEGPEAESDRSRPWLVLGGEGDALDFALPLRIVRTRVARSTYPWALGLIPVPAVIGLLNAHNRMSSVIIREGADGATVPIAAALARVPWRVAIFGMTAEDSPLWPSLEVATASLGRPMERRDDANARLSLDGTFGEHLGKHRTLRKDVGYARRSLEREFGPIEVECLRGPDAVRRGFPGFVDVDRESWKIAAGGESLATAPRARRFYEGMVEAFACGDRCAVWILRLRGEPAASVLSFFSGGVLYTYKISHKAKFATHNRLRPGFVLLSFVIERSWGTCTAIDFMSGTIPREWKGATQTLRRCTRVREGVLARLLGGARNQLATRAGAP
jgi:hypothetical protein